MTGRLRPRSKALEGGAQGPGLTSRAARATKRHRSGIRQLHHLYEKGEASPQGTEGLEDVESNSIVLSQGTQTAYQGLPGAAQRQEISVEIVSITIVAAARGASMKVPHTQNPEEYFSHLTARRDACNATDHPDRVRRAGRNRIISSMLQAQNLYSQSKPTSRQCQIYDTKKRK
ncbi:uncharacterized protein BDR25DRAFT_356962 [Lindgomyces ingoldianus]|uniref:Uncharacterized protein n=1 Tax=Lindgomyces ingoldianus TaxID=673940 RepID=A0ACB6QSN5_9PLEO|nr:uncharacterized protein BDR25DRAFT_356962 [Lindgomyces ingoldianus]KAF2469191.1 hypothetical protein BDR25DRAFT_356962 [Lindgomyces ingoldianus]